ncbi:MAG: hypothetical protein ABSA31_09545 [Acidimicrobiales bacterium]|jgi:hypothetical protein
MSEVLYVPVDEGGVEHAAAGDVAWALPGDDGVPVTTDAARGLVLRTPAALLDVLDEVIYRAEPVHGAAQVTDGAMTVSSARLTTRTPWGTESAARFALACASHVLGDRADLRLPDGSTLGEIAADAQHVLEETGPDSAERLGRLARLSDLWRLHREREELGDVAFDLALDDEAKNLDTFDDPAYESVVPVIDAVLAAITALRHYALPRSEVNREERREEREEHRALGTRSMYKPPTVQGTPFGSVMVGGGPRLGGGEPSWTGARESARHARLAARAAKGATGERGEREWQAAMLSSLLESGR